MKEVSFYEEAKSVETPPERLLAISQFADQELEELLANNANTPLSVLCSLWKDHPAAFFENPLVPLLFLEDPAWIENLPYKTLRSLGEHPEAPEPFLMQLAGSENPRHRQLAAAHPALPMPLLEQLAMDPVTPVSSSVLRGPRLTPALFDRVIDHCDWYRVFYDYRVMEYWEPYDTDSGEFAFHPDISKETLEHVSRHCLPFIRKASAAHPKVTPEIVERLSLDPDSDIRERIALHPKASIAVLERLSHDPLWQIRLAVLENCNATIMLVEALGYDPHPKVRHLARKHPLRPLHAIASWMLRQSPNLWVKIANNEGLSGILQLTIQYEGQEIKGLVASFAPSDRSVLDMSCVEEPPRRSPGLPDRVALQRK